MANSVPSGAETCQEEHWKQQGIVDEMLLRPIDAVLNGMLGKVSSPKWLSTPVIRHPQLLKCAANWHLHQA